MRALVLYGPNDYRVEDDWKEPELPDGWALVKVAYAGICGSDLPRFFQTGSYHSPMIIGHEFSGVVAKQAKGGSIAEGTPVAILPIIPCGECSGCRKTAQPFHCRSYQFIGSRNDGGFAQYCAVKEENLFPLASKAELKVGAMIELLSVGLHVVRRSGPVREKSIVFGAGPIGLSCALWLKFLGSDVTIVDIRDFSLQIARDLGLHGVSFDELEDGILFDCAYEASGAASAIVKAVEVVDDLGSITVVGRNPKETAFPSKVFEKLMRKELTLNGCWGYNLKGEEALMQKFLAENKVERMISHIISLDESIQMLEDIKEKKCDYCKVMIQLNDLEAI